MKYIITINQKAIADMGLQDRLDFIDLAIYDFITDFMLCEKCQKTQINGTQYFWIKTDLILENLPLLKINTARGLNKRIEKLVDCKLLERCPDNQNLHQSYYKVGEKYEEYKFLAWNKSSKGAWNESSDNNNTIPNAILTISDNKLDNKKEKDKSFSQKDELFEKCYIAYRRKCESKKKAKECWDKLSQKEKELVLPHVKAYTASRELQYQKAFERYLRDKTFKTVVVSGNEVVYDPSHKTSNEYHPQETLGFLWNEQYRCFLAVGYDEKFIPDGYNDDDRPDGATVKLNNARGTIVWNKEQKRWINITKEQERR